MGKDWDKAVPSVEIWKECLRVLKPGAFAFVMSAPRQDVLSQMIVRLGEAGFDTGFTSIYWTYASGFPKAMNMGKSADARVRTGKSGPTAINRSELSKDGGEVVSALQPNNGILGEKKEVVKRDGAELVSDEAKSLDGSYAGFQPKPAVEIIIVAMKPLSEKTYVDQALKNGKGVTWLDDCRIGTSGGETHKGGFQNDGKERKSGWKNTDKASDANTSSYSIKKEAETGEHYADSGSYSRFFSLDAWRQANEKAGNHPASSNPVEATRESVGAKSSLAQGDEIPLGHSRADETVAENGLDVKSLPEHVRKVFPFLLVAKASKREKNEGLEGFPDTNANREGAALTHAEGRKASTKNSHPTTKPLTLMSYLVTLGSRPNDVVLDPFLGSGTTACAAKALGRKYVGIEREEEYVRIAEARISAVNAGLL